jgi:hypothetical protein
LRVYAHLWDGDFDSSRRQLDALLDARRGQSQGTSLSALGGGTG